MVIKEKSDGCDNAEQNPILRLSVCYRLFFGSNLVTEFVAAAALLGVIDFD
jgi:hypothetical protein